MSHQPATPLPSIRLYQVGHESQIEVFEIAANQAVPYVSRQPLGNEQIQQLIEELLRYLPESKRQAFYMKIRTDEMI